MEEACVCRGHDSGPIELDNTPDRPARSSLDGRRPAYEKAITRSRQGKLTALLPQIDVAVLRARKRGCRRATAGGRRFHQRQTDRSDRRRRAGFRGHARNTTQLGLPRRYRHFEERRPRWAVERHSPPEWQQPWLPPYGKIALPWRLLRSWTSSRVRIRTSPFSSRQRTRDFREISQPCRTRSCTPPGFD